MIDKDYKKKLKAEFKSREKQTLELDMRLTKGDLSSLFDHLDTVNCDHTLRHTKEFLVSINADLEVVIPWLKLHGGHCDCEVLANVENAYEFILNR